MRAEPHPSCGDDFSFRPGSACRLAPKDNLYRVTTSITDKQRILILDEYRASGLTQEAFCEELRASHGFNVAARTLRAWCRRSEQPTNSTEACVQIVTNAIERLQDVVKGLLAAMLFSAAIWRAFLAHPASPFLQAGPPRTPDAGVALRLGRGLTPIKRNLGCI